MNNRDIPETVVTLIPEIAHACGLDKSEIQILKDECNQYDDTKLLTHLLSLLSFAEHGYLTTPALQQEMPGLREDIQIAKIGLDALIKLHLLNISAEHTAALARIENKIDQLQTNHENMVKGKRSKWFGKKARSTKTVFFNIKKPIKTDDEITGYTNLRRTQVIRK